MKVVCHSYGAGVQSIAILYKYINNEIKRPDVVVFADAVDGDKTQTNLFTNECEGYCGL